MKQSGKKHLKSIRHNADDPHVGGDRMKRILILLVVLLIVPSILYAELSYFLACEEGKIIDGQDRDKNISFKKGDLFEVPNHASNQTGLPSVNKYEEGTPKKLAKAGKKRKLNDHTESRSNCWSDSGDPICPLAVSYKTAWYRTTYSNQKAIYDHYGLVELKLGCWFKSVNAIPFKDKSNIGLLREALNITFLGEVANAIEGTRRSAEEELFVDKTLDKEFVDSMCSPHATQFSVAGNMITDIKMEKSEKHLKWVEKERLDEEAMNERLRQEEEAKEEKARIEREEQRILREKEAAELKAWQEEIRRKYGVEKVARIGDLEINPYEYEGRTIAVLVQFQKMLSSTSAIFFSGYTNLRDATGAPDQIIVTGIPKGTHFKGGFMAPKVMLALKGKGTIDGTNAFGANIRAPHFQWVGIIYRE